jgi:hypothetical protein
MPKIQTYDVYLMPAAGATKTYSATDVLDVYELNATGGTITLAADMIFSYSGTPIIGSEFKFQYSGGITSNTAGGITVSFLGTDLTDAQALAPLVILAYWNGSTWEITIVKDTKDNVISVTTFGATPNANGLTVATGGILNMQPASALYGGGVSTTTQTFAGAKTFDILSGNFSIDSSGVGIGTAASANRYVNILKTFTVQPPSLSSNIGLTMSTTYTYAAANTDEYSISVGANSSVTLTGIYTPKVVTALFAATSNNMTAVTLEKTFGVRTVHLSSGSTNNAVTTFNADFMSASYAAKTNATLSTAITTNYSYYSAIPFQNNDTAGLTPSLFTITKQYGFYCENYNSGNKVPIAYGSGAATKVSAVMTDAWQLYMSGTSLTTVGSYIGNRLGIGFATEPTTNSQVTALLHIGAGTTGSAQIRLAVATAAPSAPNDGDLWFESNTNTGLKIRINGVTKTVTLS